MRDLSIAIDGNEAVAKVAYHLNEVIAIYPITPASTMGELADQWASEGRENFWGCVPKIIEMQSEGGAAGTLHGAIQAGAVATTFTASQGILLMIPDMYKIAGELTPTVFHIAARSVATHALSIFGDHSDVMAARATGFAMLASNTPQEAHDFALISHCATFESRLPFLHFFDGFRTSHEIAKTQLLDEVALRAMVEEQWIRDHRSRALTPDRPFVRGTAQNPDVFFQSREAANPFYLACPSIVQNMMDRFAELTGRKYSLFDYHGAPDAERVIVLMGSGCEAVHEAVDRLVATGEKVGLVKVRLFRPFSEKHFLAALPRTVKAVAILDRTKEPGASGEPLYLDVMAALYEGTIQKPQHISKLPKMVGGRYGLSSKEFTSAMAKGIFDELGKEFSKNHFTIGINDDVTHTSLTYDASYSVEAPETVRAIFYGLGSDGTVGANKSSIKIIGEETSKFVQGYFVYDSRKAGSVTVSHLRFGPKPIRSTYLISEADFVACHQFSFLERMDVLERARPGSIFLLNSPYDVETVWDHLPADFEEELIRKKIRFYIVDAYRLAREAGLGGRISTIMQTCFFALSNVLPLDQAISAIKKAVETTYAKRGESILRKNFAVIDVAGAQLHEVHYPEKAAENPKRRGFVPEQAPSFVQKVTAQMLAAHGDDLPVSALPVDGTYPSATTQWEKRNIALEIPVWDENLCIQCGKCVLVCPHAVIRGKVYNSNLLVSAPATFKSVTPRWQDRKEEKYTIQVSPEDCTGCSLCVQVCPAKSKSESGHKAINMRPQAPLRETEARNWDFFINLPDPERKPLNLSTVKDVQLLRPLFEFSGACAGCGETPYLKLLSQLFGDRAIIANGTGCSSIYGGNLPTTPWAKNSEGRGPAWSNSLFEDNAEFGLGMRLALNKQADLARALLPKLAPLIGDELVEELLAADQSTEEGIGEQRKRIEFVKQKLKEISTREAKDFCAVADALAKKSVWIVGGDGWAYDIDFGGLDHVAALAENVNLLVLDTEVYSNTGGQASKATPRGAVAKFAAAGKDQQKKDLGLMLMSYGNIYVARVAMGGSDVQTIKAFREAEAYEGASVIIAYSHCVAHGYDLAHGMEQQKAAVQTGYWPLFRYNPDLVRVGKNPLQLDSKPPSLPLERYAYNEARYTILAQSRPEISKALLTRAQEDVNQRWRLYEYLAAMPGTSSKGGAV